jgi:uncharacterized membrane protein (UPF0127 family)
MAATLSAHRVPVCLAMVALGLLSCGQASPDKPAPAPASTPAEKPVTKPADQPASKPAEKPADKPADKPAEAPAPAGFQKLTIGGRVFNLELALTPARRFRGLSERTSIPADGGMLFVFSPRETQVHGFVMRDCPVPIDIIYLDRSGRVVAFHEMLPEPPRAEDEKELLPPAPGAPDWARVNLKYESRLKQYSSRFPSQFVVELAGGTIKTLPNELKVGDAISADWKALSARAQ